jgi:surface protein
MEWMFYCAENFNQDISGWDVSNVTDMSLLVDNYMTFNEDIDEYDSDSE